MNCSQHSTTSSLPHKFRKLDISFFRYCIPAALKRFTYSKDSMNLERCSNQFPDTVQNVARCATKIKSHLIRDGFIIC